MKNWQLIRQKFLMLFTAFLLAASLANINDACAQEPGEFSAADGVQGVAEMQKEPEALLDPNLYMGIQEAYQYTMKMRGEPGIAPEDIKTLFFTMWQHTLLQEAKKGFVTRRPEAYELNKEDDQERRIKGPRELSLGGIIYRSSKDWVVWLNSQRLTPDAIPEEVIDIRVKEDFVELKWYDAWTDLIYPVRIRPHQRFNLDTRIFLPGTSTL